MSITEFLEARIAEDEHAARLTYATSFVGRIEGGGSRYDLAERMDPPRVLAECAAKRAIIGEHSPVDFTGLGMDSPNACRICGIEVSMSDWEWMNDSFPCLTLKALASTYADHPDYQQEWAL